MIDDLLRWMAHHYAKANNTPSHPGHQLPPLLSSSSSLPRASRTCLGKRTIRGWSWHILEAVRCLVCCHTLVVVPLVPERDRRWPERAADRRALTTLCNAAGKTNNRRSSSCSPVRPGRPGKKGHATRAHRAVANSARCPPACMCGSVWDLRRRQARPAVGPMGSLLRCFRLDARRSRLGGKRTRGSRRTAD